MREINTNSAFTEAVQKEMEKDQSIILMGEDIISTGGCFCTYMGCPQRFPDRCLDMPIAESGYTHFSNGLALAGMRPIVDLAFSSFATIAGDAIINGAADFRFCSLGKVKVPSTFVMANGGGGVYDGVGFGCNHSQCMESMFTFTPGLKVVMPYYPSDVHGLLRASIRDDDPVVFLYDIISLGMRENVDFTAEDDYIIPLTNAAKIIREGSDVTVVALQSMIPIAIEAANELEKRGIFVELIDPRVLIPFDSKKVIESVRKTGKLVIVHEAHTRGSFAGEIIKSIMVEDASLIKKPVKVLGALNAPLGSGYTEAYIMPHAKDVITAVEALMKK